MHDLGLGHRGGRAFADVQQHIGLFACGIDERWRGQLLYFIGGTNAQCMSGEREALRLGALVGGNNERGCGERRHRRNARCGFIGRGEFEAAHEMRLRSKLLQREGELRARLQGERSSQLEHRMVRLAHRRMNAPARGRIAINRRRCRVARLIEVRRRARELQLHRRRCSSLEDLRLKLAHREVSIVLSAWAAFGQ